MSARKKRASPPTDPDAMLQNVPERPVMTGREETSTPEGTTSDMSLRERPKRGSAEREGY